MNSKPNLKAATTREIVPDYLVEVGSERESQCAEMSEEKRVARGQCRGAVRGRGLASSTDSDTHPEARTFTNIHLSSFPHIILPIIAFDSCVLRQLTGLPTQGSPS